MAKLNMFKEDASLSVSRVSVLKKVSVLIGVWH